MTLALRSTDRGIVIETDDSAILLPDNTQLAVSKGGATYTVVLNNHEKVYQTDSLTLNGSPFSGTAAQLLATLAPTPA